MKGRTPSVSQVVIAGFDLKQLSTGSGDPSVTEQRKANVCDPMDVLIISCWLSKTLDGVFPE